VDGKDESVEDDEVLVTVGVRGCRDVGHCGQDFAAGRGEWVREEETEGKVTQRYCGN